MGRVGICKPLYQKPVSLWHIISWCLKGLMGLGTPHEADGKVWVSSSDFLLLFSTSFSSIPLGGRDVSLALAGKLQGRAVHTRKVTAFQWRLVGLWEWVLQDLPGCWENMWLDLLEALPYGSCEATAWLQALLTPRNPCWEPALVASLW